MRFSIDHYEYLCNLLRWRRDVRHFRPDPIEPAVLAKLEQAVDYAPSVGNSRPWRIIRVHDKVIRAEIITSFEHQNLLASKRYADQKRVEYLALKLSGMKEAPLHLAFFTETEPMEGHGLGRQTMPETLAYSTVMAIHTFWLAARAMNIGVGWVSIIDPAVVETSLGVPETWHLTGYICAGYPLEEWDTPELERLGWQAIRKSIWIDR